MLHNTLDNLGIYEDSEYIASTVDLVNGSFSCSTAARLDLPMHLRNASYVIVSPCIS